MFASLRGGEGFARPAVPLVKEGFSPARVDSMTWTIIGSALTARASECFMKLTRCMTLL